METDLTCKRKRISIELSAPIVDKLDDLARKVESSRSELIRRLITESLLEKDKEEIEASLKEGYLANYEFVKESSRGWDFTSGDGLC
jgi:metal-responsive CopG/Arc/MetJ family transcriptional regulator